MHHIEQDNIVFCPLTDIERRVYERALNTR
jgi:hypothetical protein